MIGSVLALIAAAFFGLNAASVRRGVLTGTVLQGMAISVPIGIPVFLAAALVTGSLGSLAGLSLRSMGLLAAAGIVHFVWGRYCNFRATKAMGSNLVGPVQQSNLLLSLALAVWLLDETLTPLRILGICLIIGGPAVMLRARRAAKSGSGGEYINDEAAIPVFTPKYAEGYSFALLSALGFGTSAILIRAALVGTDPGSGIAGGIISYCAAAIVVATVLLQPKNLRHALAMTPTTAKWFTLSGIFVGLSQLFRFMALSVAPVTVVSPIQQTSVAFRVLFAWVLNREHEAFSGWVLLGILISLTGATALSISTAFVLAHFPLPEFLVGIAHWQWP